MLSQARVRPEAGVLPSVSSRGLVVGPHGVFHNEESIRVTSYRAVRAVAMTPSRSAGERPRGPLPGAGPRRAAPAAQRRPTVVALSSLGLAAAVVASVGVVGLGAATSLAAVPRPDAVGAPLPVAELRGVQTSRGETRVTRQGDAMLPEGPAVGDARAERKAVAERQAELEATAEAIDRETQRLSDVAAQQRQLAAREAEREAERAKAAEAASKAFVWPTAGGVSSGFGYRVHPILKTRKLHNGADIGGACGQPIVAVRAGVVTRAERSGSNGGAGHNVRIDHGPVGGAELETAYLHMGDVAVKVGQRVETGQRLGTVGSTGLSTACHLHLSLYKDGAGSDPLAYLTK